jgi:hypothetical protein
MTRQWRQSGAQSVDPNHLQLQGHGGHAHRRRERRHRPHQLGLRFDAGHLAESDRVGNRRPSTVFLMSSAVTGASPIFALSASAMNSLSLTVSCKAFCKSARDRSACRGERECLGDFARIVNAEFDQLLGVRRLRRSIAKGTRRKSGNGFGTVCSTITLPGGAMGLIAAAVALIIPVNGNRAPESSATVKFAKA